MTAVPATRAKARLRCRCRRQRQRLAPEYVVAAGRAILERLQQLPEYQHAELVHTYASTPAEVDTHGLIAACLDSGRRVAVPVVRPGTRRLAHVELLPGHRLVPDAWGIPTPEPGVTAPPCPLSAIELVVVPGVAFDRQGHRLGLGGGYYDRFLSQAQAPRVGLTYAALLLEAVPSEPHDMVMDVVVTERETVETHARRD